MKNFRRLLPLLLPLLLLLALVVPASFARRGLCEDARCACDARNRATCACTRPHESISLRAEDFDALPDITQLHVANCSRVEIASDAVRTLRELRLVRLSNVEDLVLAENSLYWLPPGDHSPHHEGTGLRISLENSTVHVLPPNAIKGRIEVLNLDGLRVSQLRSFAVSTMSETKSVVVRNCAFATVESQPFKKFGCDTFGLFNNTFAGELPSRFLSDVDVRDVLELERNRVPRLRSNCFVVDEVGAVLIHDNDIGVIDGEAFKMAVRTEVDFSNNIIHDLQPNALIGFTSRDFTASRQPIKRELRFANNTLTALELDSMAHNALHTRLVIKELRVNATCSCSTNKLLSQYAKSSDEVRCRKSASSASYVSLAEHEKASCGGGSQGFSVAILVIIIVFSALVILAVVVSVGYAVRRYCMGGRSVFFVERKPDVADDGDAANNLRIVKPDGRTYKETELYVIVEKADLLTTDL